MRIAVDCKSPLLQKSLEVFLGKYLSSVKQCELVIKDQKTSENKKCFYIASEESADLQKPFTKAQLILALEQRYKTLYAKKLAQIEEKKLEEKIAISDEPLPFSILEERIEYLTKEYQQNILKAVKAFYEK